MAQRDPLRASSARDTHFTEAMELQDLDFVESSTDVVVAAAEDGVERGPAVTIWEAAPFVALIVSIAVAFLGAAATISLMTPAASAVFGACVVLNLCKGRVVPVAAVAVTMCVAGTMPVSYGTARTLALLELSRDSASATAAMQLPPPPPVFLGSQAVRQTRTIRDSGDLGEILNLLPLDPKTMKFECFTTPIYRLI